MAAPIIEHVNLTVSDNRRAAALFSSLFGWHIRWEGPARDGGHSIHVGDERFYLALYTPPVGGTLFVAAKLAGAGIGEITKQLLPLMVVTVSVVLLITYVPALSQWLPALVNR